MELINDHAKCQIYAYDIHSLCNIIKPEANRHWLVKPMTSWRQVPNWNCLMIIVMINLCIWYPQALKKMLLLELTGLNQLLKPMTCWRQMYPFVQDDSSRFHSTWFRAFKTEHFVETLKSNSSNMFLFLKFEPAEVIENLDQITGKYRTCKVDDTF